MRKTLTRYQKRYVVAISWDHGQTLVLISNLRRDQIDVLEMLTLDAEWSDGPEAIGTQLKAELKKRGIGSFRLLVGLPRSQIEMVDLTLPPASDQELPELVRLDVFRRLTDLPETALIDFVVRGNHNEPVRQIEAAVLRPEVAAEIHKLGAAAGRAPTRIVLRSFAIASLFGRLAGQDHSTSLLLNPMDFDVDMSVLSRDEVLFSRTVRLPNNASDQLSVSRVSEEIQRTLAVAPLDSQDEMGVEHVYMFGDLQRHSDFIEQLADDLNLPVSLLDPTVGLNLLVAAKPQTLHRYTALIGMVHDEAAGCPPVDFSNPKQPPSPPKYGQKIAFYAAVAASVLLIVGYRLKSDIEDVRIENRQTAADLEREQQLLKRLTAKTQVVNSVALWHSSEIDWLRELRELSERFPPADRAVVQNITMSPSVGGQSLISMGVRVDQQRTISLLESNLRDEFHRVASKRISQAKDQTAFPFQFDTTVYVEPRPESTGAEVSSPGANTAQR